MLYSLLSGGVVALAVALWALVLRSQRDRARDELAVKSAQLETCQEHDKRLDAVRQDLEKQLDYWTQKGIGMASHADLRDLLKRLLRSTDGQADPVPAKPAS